MKTLKTIITGVCLLMSIASNAQQLIAFDLSFDKKMKSFSLDQQEELKSNYDGIKYDIPCGGMGLTTGERKSRFIRIDKTITDFSLDYEAASKVMSKSEVKHKFLTATISKSKAKNKVVLTSTFSNEKMEVFVETEEVDANMDTVLKSFSDMITRFCK